MPNPENLTPWQKGVSGNPNGRPKKVRLTEELERQLAEGATLEQVVKATILQAAKGNGVAMKIVWDRIDGPIVQKTDITSDGHPIKALVGVDIDQI